jgi:hypothetical protein
MFETIDHGLQWKLQVLVLLLLVSLLLSVFKDRDSMFSRHTFRHSFSLILSLLLKIAHWQWLLVALKISSSSNISHQVQPRGYIKVWLDLVNVAEGVALGQDCGMAGLQGWWPGSQVLDFCLLIRIALCVLWRLISSQWKWALCRKPPGSDTAWQLAPALQLTTVLGGKHVCLEITCGIKWESTRSSDTAHCSGSQEAKVISVERGKKDLPLFCLKIGSWW